MAKLSPRRLVQLGALWRALHAGTRPGAPVMVDRLRALPRMVGQAGRRRYPGLGMARIAMIAVAIAYLLSPIDFMPEALLTVFGLGDDASSRCGSAGCSSSRPSASWSGSAA